MPSSKSPTDPRPEPGGQVPIYFTAHAVFWFGIYLIIRGPYELSLKWVVGHFLGLAIAFTSGLVIDAYMPASHRELFQSHRP